MVLLTHSDIGLLKKYRNLQHTYSLELGDKCIDSNLLFCGMFGQPMHVGNLIKRNFKTLIKLCNIQGKFTFHCLRHTHATLLLQQGVTPKIVQERLGHASIKMTMDIYISMYYPICKTWQLMPWIKSSINKNPPA